MKFFVIVSIFSSFKITAKRLDNIKIDGTICKEEKKVKIPNLYLYKPKIESYEKIKTIIYLGYNPKGLYFGFICYDSMNSLIKRYGKRDEDTQDDQVYVFLFTSSSAECYIFGSNSLGVQYDGIKKADGFEDYTPDFDFKVKANLYNNRWEVEFFIPFKSLYINNIPEKGSFSLKVIFIRIRPRNHYIIYAFPPLSENNPSFVSQAALLTIPEELTLKKRTEIIPFFAPFIQSNILKLASGVNLKCKIKNCFSLDLTFNPDYAQIETDEPKIDINTTFALFYPEKRPFFMEGKTLLETPIKAIYTRAINDPLFAGKITGRLKDFDFMFLSAYDEHTPWVLPFEEKSEYIASDKKSFSNILRIKKSIFEESYIGILTSSRDFKDLKGFNRIFGFDTRLRFKTHYTLDYQGIYSWTREIDDTLLSEEFNGEYLKGFAQEFNFNAFFRNFIGNLWLGDYSPYFRSDLGFIRRNNFREIEIRGGPRGFPNKYGLTEISLWLWYSSRWNYDNILKEKNNALSLYLSLIGQTTVVTKYSRIYRKYGKEFPDLWDYNISSYTSPSKYFSINTYFDFSKTINYSDTTKGYSFYYSLSLELKPVPRVQIGISNSRYYLYREKWRNLIYDVQTIRTKFSYQFTLHFSFRLIIDYYTKTKEVGIYPLFSYELNPFTLFYLGANISALKNGNPFGLKGQEHQIFLKFQYWFKI